MGQVRAERRRVFEQGDTVVALGHSDAAKDDLSARLPVGHIWRYRGERICRLEIITDTLTSQSFSASPDHDRVAPSAQEDYRQHIEAHLNKYMHAHRNAAVPARRCARAPVWQGSPSESSWPTKPPQADATLRRGGHPADHRLGSSPWPASGEQLTG
jgi:hypothetical protein